MPSVQNTFGVPHSPDAIRTLPLARHNVCSADRGDAYPAAARQRASCGLPADFQRASCGLSPAVRLWQPLRSPVPKQLPAAAL